MHEVKGHVRAAWQEVLNISVRRRAGWHNVRTFQTFERDNGYVKVKGCMADC